MYNTWVLCCSGAIRRWNLELNYKSEPSSYINPAWGLNLVWESFNPFKSLGHQLCSRWEKLTRCTFVKPTIVQKTLQINLCVASQEVDCSILWLSKLERSSPCGWKVKNTHFNHSWWAADDLGVFLLTGLKRQLWDRDFFFTKRASRVRANWLVW